MARWTDGRARRGKGDSAEAKCAVQTGSRMQRTSVSGCRGCSPVEQVRLHLASGRLDGTGFAPSNRPDARCRNIGRADSAH